MVYFRRGRIGDVLLVFWLPYLAGVEILVWLLEKTEYNTVKDRTMDCDKSRNRSFLVRFPENARKRHTFW